jgi:hypothetical protein
MNEQKDWKQISTKYKRRVENTPRGKEMIDATKWLCSRRGDGDCEILVMEHEGKCLIDFEGKKKYHHIKLRFHVWIINSIGRLILRKEVGLCCCGNLYTTVT